MSGRRRWWFYAPVAAVAALLATAAGGHDGVVHETPDEALQHLRDSPNTPGFPTNVGGPYRLIDHHGKRRTEIDPDGRHQLVFFGYASCKAICSVALPAMVSTVDQLAAEGIDVTPVLITVDRKRDTVAALRKAAPDIHPRLVGLTGSRRALAKAYDAFQVESKLVYDHPTEGPIYAHGSFVYLMGPDGAFKTVMPPILGPERMAEIVTSYVSPASN